jgi:hypothetical protein
VVGGIVALAVASLIILVLAPNSGDDGREGELLAGSDDTAAGDAVVGRVTTTTVTTNPVLSTATAVTSATSEVTTTTTTTAPPGPIQVVGARASNTRPAVTSLRCGGSADYEAMNLVDGNDDTGWGASSTDGTGETITLDFGRTVQLTRIGLTPGYLKFGPRYDQGCASVSAFEFNRFVTAVEYRFDDGSAVTHHFEWQPTLQFQDVDVQTSTVTILILGTSRPAGADDDTILSEAVFEGRA